MGSQEFNLNLRMNLKYMKLLELEIECKQVPFAKEKT